ncbi:2-oxoglutarate dehydrogenase E1 component [Candidatus Xenohaliotis californiensis]|uniref:2-oxoglutarate dehydrogenase E1 component n=1 Tax=Candidatus Xenohaliotis californiensis TaxID=84677 RepID=A0ABP0ETC7_9RICK|nr:2-oxoglutarate dehydrogenase E1 component [Candidatus Xenohaliotis californiensis]
MDNGYLFSENAVFLCNMHNSFIHGKLPMDEKFRELFVSIGLDDDVNVELYQSIKMDYKLCIIKDENLDTNNENNENCIANCGDITSIVMLYIVEKYRSFGFLYANLNPLNDNSSMLFFDVATQDLDYVDPNMIINCGNYLGLGQVSIRLLMEKLRNIYCGHLSIDFGNIAKDQKEWLADRLENNQCIASDIRCIAHDLLLRVSELENFLHLSFVGGKRFSSEGLESVVLALEIIVQQAANAQYKEVAIGMAHRGRIAALREVVDKDLESIFFEFGPLSPYSTNSINTGDVRYHNGFRKMRNIGNNNIRVCILNSPSHLESVDGVLMGSVRAMQDSLPQDEKISVIGILVHGDAAVMGQGVVAESTVMGSLDAYSSMGTIHIIANNQVGFTANIDETRLTKHPTSFAHLINAPVLHVNADSPDHVISAMNVAFAFREKFKSDIVVNIIGYRKYGHNEMDEPRFTQPLMYNIIANKCSVVEIYGKKLMAENILSDDKIKQTYNLYYKAMEDALKHVTNGWSLKIAPFNQWGINLKINDNITMRTGINVDLLKKLAKQGSYLPKGFTVNKQIKRFMSLRADLFANGVNWSNAEFLAFASLLLDGFNIRFAGQDSRRGTFSQRHAVILDVKTEKQYIPLHNINTCKGVFSIYNSLLSEYAAMAFEYGYSITDQNTLVIWEAQFGDFANGAQIVIDQYLSASESKWLQSSGLVLLLPHGYEGQGPEHSSARVERFLQLCANNNMRVVNCSTPANYFHILRMQTMSKLRKPLIIFSVKSLLRHKMAVSSINDMAIGTHFKPIIHDKCIGNVRKVIFCSGKVYYDLISAMDNNNDIAVIRIEILYPFPSREIAQILQNYGYRDAKIFIWLQEEPKNMGAWFFIRDFINQILTNQRIKCELEYVGRPVMAAPSFGYAALHSVMQLMIVNSVLNR